MEGGATLFVTLILVGAGIGGFLLFGAQEAMDPDSANAAEVRPEHLYVDDDAGATTKAPPAPPTRATPSE